MDMNPTRSIETKLHEELRGLRRGAGLSLAKLRACKTLLKLPIVQAASAASNVGPAQAAFDLLESAAKNVAGRPGKALRFAWAVDFEGKAEDLGGRRTAASRTYPELTVGHRQLTRLEDKAISDVIAGLLEFQPRDQAPPLIPKPPQSGGKTSEGHYPSTGYTLDFIDITYTVVDRQPTEWHQYESVRATVDGLAGITPRYTFTGDPKSVEVFVWQGGRLGDQFAPTEFGVYAYNIEFPKPLKRNQPHQVRYSRKMKRSEIIAAPWVGFGPVVPTEHLIVRAHFVGELPSRVETRIGLGMSFPSPLEPPQEVEIGPDGIAECAFENLVSGWGYGLEWTWESA